MTVPSIYNVYDEKLFFNYSQKSLFNLPEEVKFCKNCVISNQRPNSSLEFLEESKNKTSINFNEDGICDACNFSFHKEKINWEEKNQELIDLCDKFRDPKKYDCLIPGSGGKDSFYAAHMLKYKYGMNPLTVTWAPHIYTDWGRKNHDSWIKAGFDNILFTPDTLTKRLLTRLSTEILLHPFQTFILGQKNIAPALAMKYDIPLIFYGENESEYGNPIDDNDSSLRSEKYYTYETFDDIFLGGVSISDLNNKFKVKEISLNSYLPSKASEVNQNNIEVHYLGYYLKWHPQTCYYYSVEHGGFEASPERTPGTYSKYNSIDDKIDDFHYYTTFVKFGIGRASYDAAQEIRSGDITRQEGVHLVKKFDGEFPDRFSDEIFEYLSIEKNQFPSAYKQFEHPEFNRDYFEKLCDTFRSPHLWDRTQKGFNLKHKVFDENNQ